MNFGIGNQINALSAIELSSGERQQTPSIQDAAEQFEAVFVAQLLKVMRESVESSGLFGDGFAGKQVHLEMMDQEMARELVRQGGFGLAEQIRHYLEEAQQREAGLGAPGPTKNLPNEPQNDKDRKETDDMKRDGIGMQGFE